MSFVYLVQQELALERERHQQELLAMKTHATSSKNRQDEGSVASDEKEDAEARSRSYSTNSADGDEGGADGGRRATMWDVMVGNLAEDGNSFDVMDMVTSPMTESRIQKIQKKHEQDLKVALQLQEEEHMAALDLFKAEIREEVEEQVQGDQEDELIEVQEELRVQGEELLQYKVRLA
jgi:hypothetical protein